MGTGIFKFGDPSHTDVYNLSANNSFKRHFYAFAGIITPANMLAECGNRYIRQSELTFNAKGDLQIVEGLKLTGQYGVRIYNYDNKTENRTATSYGWDDIINRRENLPNSVNYDASYNRYSSYTAHLEYAKSFAEKHNISLIEGASHEENVAGSKNRWGANSCNSWTFLYTFAT